MGCLVTRVKGQGLGEHKHRQLPIQQTRLLHHHITYRMVVGYKSRQGTVQLNLQLVHKSKLRQGK